MLLERQSIMVKMRHRLIGHTDKVRSVAFSPTDSLLASGSDDRTVKIWHLEEAKLVRDLAAHTDWVKSVAFAPRQRIVASGSWDKTIRLWHLETGEEIRRHSAHQGIAFQVAFSLDGGTIYSVSADETLVAWQPGDPSLPALLDWIERNRYVRQLTCEEREQYDIKPLCK